MGRLVTHFILRLLCLMIPVKPTLAYSLKNCSMVYQKNLSSDVSLDCTNRKLVTVPGDIPKGAISVQLFNNLLTEIGKEDFAGMSKLRYLNLDYNNISQVDDGSFADLMVLKKLTISRNKLTNLTQNIFQGLSSLIELDLSENIIQFIHIFAFQLLTNLQALDLGQNMLHQVADIQPILQLPQIQMLKISSNEYSSFETKDLMLNLTSSLKYLDVSSNQLEKFSITSPVFPYLKTLDLSLCGQDYGLEWNIPHKTLLRSIKHLYLNHPSLSFEGIQKVLQNLTSLKHLRLKYVGKWIKQGLIATVCKIPTLRRLEMFYNYLNKYTLELAPCSQLSELDLSITQISELPKGSIRSMTYLRFLNVDTNFLTKVPYDIRSLAYLEILNLNGNLISELSCEDFVNTTHLTELSLNTNRITMLNKCAFKNLNNLKLLDLSYNQLWTFSGTFETTLQNLEILDISQNIITFLEWEDFQGLHSLKQLNVTSDHIARVTRKTFYGLRSLETLTLSLALEYDYNTEELQRLEKSLHQNNSGGFSSIKSLRSFTVTCTGYHYGFPLYVPIEMLQVMNHLENFTAVNVYSQAPSVDTFQFNPQLRSLKLTMSDLSDLDSELFQPVPHLQALDLSECKLRSLDFLVQANFSELRYLKLSDNEIAVINEAVFQSLPSLTYLDIDNNPFTCDCSNAGFIQWVKNNKQILVVNAHQYTCSFPVAEKGSMLLDFDTQPCWPDGNFICFISSTCLVVLTLLTSFSYHFLRWQLVFTFYLFLAFLYDSRKRGRAGPHQFDAFISYNFYDEDWVYREMLPVLEGEQGWRLCLHHRDFQPGKPIIENITDAIYGSRKTICVISRRYLQSEWCSREIQMASFRLFDEQKDVLILLFLEEIPVHQLSPYYRMRRLVKKRTYLSWLLATEHKGVFWQRVQAALQMGDDRTGNTDLLTGPTAC